ncbi:MAG: hypothetical protein ACRD6N_01925, partial [Pyrinomonadaceae bacterium]
MLIVERLSLFLNWLVITAIVIVVALILLRVIANAADLNPFGWAARTIRHLTDPIIMPVRRGLMGFGVDPKYAPLVSILLAILLGWFTIQIVSSIGNTTIGMLQSVKSGEIVPLIGYLLYGMLGLYS